MNLYITVQYSIVFFIIHVLILVLFQQLPQSTHIILSVSYFITFLFYLSLHVLVPKHQFFVDLFGLENIIFQLFSIHIDLVNFYFYLLLFSIQLLQLYLLLFNLLIFDLYFIIQLFFLIIPILNLLLTLLTFQLILLQLYLQLSLFLKQWISLYTMFFIFLLFIVLLVLIFVKGLSTFQ